MANKSSGSSPSSSGSSGSSGSGSSRSPASAPRAKTSTPSKRVTPKGTTPDKRGTSKGSPSAASGRYTPPIPKVQKVSPIWVPILMFTCLLLGMVMIILNYVSVLPDSPSNGWLLGGLGLITVGFITATKYH